MKLEKGTENVYKIRISGKKYNLDYTFNDPVEGSIAEEISAILEDKEKGNIDTVAISATDKKYRDENGKLRLSSAELAQATAADGAEYYTVGGTFYSCSDGYEYVRLADCGETAVFKTAEGRTLLIPSNTLGTLLPDVASTGMEFIKIK